MSITVTMPQLGETVTEGTILRWAKQPGDTIVEDEVLLEISTDKVDTEVPSPASGVLTEILVPEGETVEVGAALAVISAAGEAAEPAPVVEAAPAPSPSPEPVPVAEAAPAPGTAVPVAPAPEAPAAAESAAPVVPAPAAPTAPAAPEPTVASPVPAPVAEPTPVSEPAPVSVPEATRVPPLVPTAEVEIVAAVPEIAPASSAVDDLGMLSPVVRKLASEHGIDLSLVTGTGRDSRITRKDVQAFIDAGAVTAAAAAAPAPVPAPEVESVEVAVAESVEVVEVESVEVAVAEPVEVVEVESVEVAGAEPVEVVEVEPAPIATMEPVPEPMPEAVVAPEPTPPADTGPRGIPLRPGDRVESISRLRKRIADNMVEARRTAAHVWTLVEVDYERIEQFRKRRKDAYKEAEGFSLTYLPFIARATIDALRAFPIVNSAFFQEEEQRVMHDRVDLGIAVDLDQEGLIVMTVRGAEQMRMRSLARDIRAVAAKARSGEYTLDDVTGSTFTITNPGPFGSLMSAPVINVPNVAILSTDAVQKRPVAVKDVDGGDAIAIHHVGTLGLTWDHRAFDGSAAVLFLRHIKQALETWDWEHELS